MRFPNTSFERTLQAILVIAVLGSAQPALAVNITWTGASFNDSWHNAANWDLNRVPGPGDDVIIPNVAGSVAIFFSTGTTTINRIDCDEIFNLQAGNLVISASTSSMDNTFAMNSGSLTVGGTLDLTAGVEWTGGTVRTTPSGLLRCSGSISRTFYLGTILDCDGTVEFTNGMTTIGPGPVLDITGVVAVTSPATVTINMDATIGTLVLNSGTVDGSGNLLVSTGFTWNAGTMAGTGATTIGPAAVLSLTPVPGGSILARHLYNEGLANHIGIHDGTINSPGLIKNRAGGILQFRSSGGFDGAGVINNQAGGLIDKTVLHVTARIGAPVLNDIGAELRVTSGTLQFNGTVTNNGLMHSLPGTGLKFSSGPNAFSSTSTLDVDNIVAFTIGTSTFDPGANMSVGDSLQLIPTGIITTGVVNLNTNASVPFLGHSAGTLQGSGNLTVTNGLLWNGGVMDGAGSTILGPGSTNTIDTNINTGNIRLNRLLVNQGTCFYDGTYTMTIQAAGILRNASGGTFNIPVESDFTSGGLFDNQAGATLFKYGGSGVSGMSGTFTNNGTLKVTTGTFQVVGTFTNFSAGTLTGGIYDLSTRFKFQGANIVTNAATIILSGSFSEIVNESDANALGSLAANAASGTLTLKNGRVLTVTPAFTNAGTLNLGEGSTGQLIANAGFLQTSGNTVFQNGTLTSSSLVRIQGGSLTGVGGTVGGNLQNDAVVSPGFSPAAISILGQYTQTASGQLLIEIGGTAPGSQFDLLSVFSSASLAGQLQVSLIDGFTPTAGQSFNVITASSRSGAFGSHNLPLPAGPACLDVAYLSNAVSIQALSGVSIGTHPQSQTICPGSPVTFSVSATGGGLGFQWRKNTVAIGGANASSFTIPSVVPADAGNYDVVVTGSCGVDTSDAAVLTLCVSAVVEDPVGTVGPPVVGNPAPNPAKGPVTLRVNLPRPSSVSVDVVDVAGRRVAILLDELAMPAGDHDVRWDGLGESGRLIPSGIYFVRVRALGAVNTRKVLIAG